MTILGVDLGKKRIGLARAEHDAKLPSPLPVMNAAGSLKRDAAQIKVVADKIGAKLIVVGLPNNVGYDDQRMVRAAKLLGDCLRELGCEVQHVDESGTSVDAAALQQSQGPIDSTAACLILERFLNEKEPG